MTLDKQVKKIYDSISPAGKPIFVGDALKYVCGDDAAKRFKLNDNKIEPSEGVLSVLLQREDLSKPLPKVGEYEKGSNQWMGCLYILECIVDGIYGKCHGKNKI